MPHEQLSKKQLKQLKKLQELERTNLEKRQSTMKWLVIGVLSFLFLIFFVGIIIFAKQQQANVPPTKLSSDGWVRGDSSAKVTLAEFSDLQCPACRAYEPTVQSVLKDYKGRVKLLYKHFPLEQVHKNSRAAIHAAEAAGKQGKFWQYHDLLFEKQDEWANLPNPTDQFVAYAQSLKLDADQFRTDMNDKSIDKKISKFEDEGIAAGVNATPTFFIDGKKVDSSSGLQYLDFKRLLDQELSKVK